MRFWATALLVLTTSCVSVTWERHHLYEPPPGRPSDLLDVGDSLQACLDELGAPLWVWERNGQGAALAWGWFDGDEVGLRVSVTAIDDRSVSVSYDDADASMHGLVLFFDSDWTLEQVRTGFLSDLRAGSPTTRSNQFDEEPTESEPVAPSE